MTTNLIKFPSDLDESDEHQHFIALRIYSNSSASLEGSSSTVKEDDTMATAPQEDDILSRLDNSRGQKPDYSNVGDNAANEGGIGNAVSDSAAAATEAVFTQTSYRKSHKVNSDAIYLPFPQSINMSDGWQWETVSFARTVVGELTAGNAAEGAEKAITTGASAVGSVIMENMDKFLDHQKARVSNPRKESNDAQTIIQLLKYHASPELYSGNNALYNYPSEFQIYFVSGGKENQYIGKIDRCALENLSVNYTNANMWSAFKDTGAPTHLKLTLEFTELSLQSRNSLKIMDGGE
jgi:hypothetical protein